MVIGPATFYATYTSGTSTSSITAIPTSSTIKFIYPYGMRNSFSVNNTNYSRITTLTTFIWRPALAPRQARATFTRSIVFTHRPIPFLRPHLLLQCRHRLHPHLGLRYLHSL